MFQEHPFFLRPENPDATIWRYLNFTKFVALLASRALWFSRADLLGDRFEGSLAAANVIERGDSSDAAPFGPDFLRVVYVNCWHLAEHESAAMWSQYSGSEGVAICSTYRRLTAALNGPLNEIVFVGRVQYLDYAAELVPADNAFGPFLTKRQSFEHEQELRAMFMSALPPLVINSGSGATRVMTQEPLEGIEVPVDLNALVAAVRVVPDAPTWFIDLVGDVMRRFDLDLVVQRSSLDGEPLY